MSEFGQPPSAGADAEYPRELQELERSAIRVRREVAGVDASKPTCGLAISGGGIRSATFHLGVIQTLARKRVLDRVDMMSTVSGGGYIGVFLGRLFDRLREDPNIEVARTVLADTDSEPIRWMRTHGKYIAPEGSGDLRLNAGIVLRNLVTLHVVLFLFLLAIFGVLNAIRYGVFDEVVALLELPISLPIGSQMEGVLGVFWSPWFLLVEILVYLGILPCMLAYWLASPRQNREHAWTTFALCYLFLATPLVVSIFRPVGHFWFVVSAVIFMAFFLVASIYEKVDRMGSAVGSGDRAAGRLRPRQYCSYLLADALGLLGLVSGVAIIDALAHGLQQWVDQNEVYAQAFVGLGATITAGWPALRKVARIVESLLSDKKSEGKAMTSVLQLPLVRVLLVLPVAAIPLTICSFASHAAFDGGSDFSTGILATGITVALSLCLTNRTAVMFINRSALSSLYSARLCRAYMGATNANRRSGAGREIDQVVAGDDVEDITCYRPYEAGGPLHLIGICLNQTYQKTAPRGVRDRKGENVAVSSLAMTVGRDDHARWLPGSARADFALDVQKLRVLGRQPGQSTPFLSRYSNADGQNEDEDGNRSPERLAIEVEQLPLRRWIGISGAAFSPGSGWRTDPLLALLMTLANVRLGYWWDSGLDADDREDGVSTSRRRRVAHLISRIFVVQSLLLAEGRARFPGPWHRHWYLSDGGFFDNTGVYELVRRRVPYVICGDAGADPDYLFEDVGDLVLKARVDFGSEIRPFTREEITAHVPTELCDRVIGTYASLRGPAERQQCYATLFWIDHRRSLARPASRSVMLLIKPGLTRDEPVDVQTYKALQPDFPQQSTADQFYDERQWESYRRLGETISAQVFASDWFFSIPVTADRDPTAL